MKYAIIGSGKIVVDLTNAFHVAPEELGGLLSSEVVSQAFVGARPLDFRDSNAGEVQLQRVIVQR
jgi:hypothetical protein